MTLHNHNSGTRILASGTATVTSAGTPVQLTAQRCKRVLLQADEGNNDTIIVVGDANVDADSNPPRGRALYATQSEVFYVLDASELYVDATANNGRVHYIAEG